MGRGVWEIKRAQAAEKEAKILHALIDRKKSLSDARKANRRRRKTVGELRAMLCLTGIEARILRSPEQFVSRSYNLERQLFSLVYHLLVVYPVPEFMFQSCLPNTFVGPTRLAREADERRREYRRWFIALAQDGKFAKMVRGVMTAKEAYVFLGAPSNGTIPSNVWWAKMRVAGVSDALIGTLYDRIFSSYAIDDTDERLPDTIRFYARFSGELDRASWDEVTDFIVYQLRNDPTFSLKGRTASSLVTLSNHWHRQMQVAKLDQHIQWTGLRVADWFFEDKAEICDVLQLRTNKELCAEGKSQRHCVYSYVSRCVEGQSAIFSMRTYRKVGKFCDENFNVVWDKRFETGRITIEVGAMRQIVQVRGPLNRAPTAEEKEIIRQWAGGNGILLPEPRGVSR